jgi:hypothetical protein
LGQEIIEAPFILGDSLNFKDKGFVFVLHIFKQDIRERYIRGQNIIPSKNKVETMKPVKAIPSTNPMTARVMLGFIICQTVLLSGYLLPIHQISNLAVPGQDAKPILWHRTR